jgi:hypothetical protein
MLPERVRTTPVTVAGSASVLHLISCGRLSVAYSVVPFGPHSSTASRRCSARARAIERRSSVERG